MAEKLEYSFHEYFFNLLGRPITVYEFDADVSQTLEENFGNNLNAQSLQRSKQVRTFSFRIAPSDYHAWLLDKGSKEAIMKESFEFINAKKPESSLLKVMTTIYKGCKIENINDKMSQDDSMAQVTIKGKYLSEKTVQS